MNSDNKRTISLSIAVSLALIFLGYALARVIIYFKG